MIYNLEYIRSFKNFFRVEGELLGFKFNFRRRLNSKCFYDFGLKFKLSGYLKKFVSWNEIFLNKLYLNSLYLKKEDLTKNIFFVFPKKQKKYFSLNFSNIYVNNFEKFKKNYFFVFFNRMLYMNFEKSKNLPIEFFDFNTDWFLKLMFCIKHLFFGKFFDFFQNFIISKKNRKIYLFFFENNKVLRFINNFKLLIKRKTLLFFLKSKNFFKRPFLKYAYYDLFFLKLLVQNKKIKKSKFKFFKKIRKYLKKSTNKGLLFNLIYNKTYVSNLFRYLLYNWNLNLKSYYNLVVINYNKCNEKSNYNVKTLLKKKNFFFLSPYSILLSKSYLPILYDFFYIIVQLYKKNHIKLVNNFYLIKKLFINFKIVLIKILNNF